LGYGFEEKIMSFVKNAILGAVAAIGLTTAANASVFQINPVISAQYSSAGVLEAGALGGAGLNAAAPNLLPGGQANKIYAIDLYVKYTPSLNEPSFGNMTFNLNTGGSIQRLAADTGTVAKRNYVPVSTLYDSDGDAAPDTPYFGQNADAGNDWVAVLLGLDSTTLSDNNGDGDVRRSVGQASNPNFGSNANGFRYGRIFVNSGSAGGTIAEFIQPVGSGSPPSTLDGKTLSNPADAGTVGGLAVITVPEPTSMLAGAGLMGLGFIRRRRA